MKPLKQIILCGWSPKGQRCWIRQIMWNQQSSFIKFWVMQQTLTSRGCVNQFKSFSKHRSFSCFVCVHVFMSLMWFFYPRASSGSLSQESKCGTPATASPMCLLCMCVHACICMCAHRISRIHYPLKALHIYICMTLQFMTHTVHACSIESPFHLTHKGFCFVVYRQAYLKEMNSFEIVWVLWCAAVYILAFRQLLFWILMGFCSRTKSLE